VCPNQLDHVKKLPVFFLEYNRPERGKIFSTESNIKLTAPPHNRLNSIKAKKWLWKTDIDLSNNWHSAHQKIIDDITRQEIPFFPKYPSNTRDIITHGAYWEGAVYYLKTVMKFSNEAEYIRERISTTTRWEEFELIYDSDGQLHLLDAHMARVALVKFKSRMSAKTIKICDKSISDIKLMYRETPYPYPNPYFGGDNPLHLASLNHIEL